MVTGYHAAKFESPWIFFTTYDHERDLTLGVFLEIFELQQ